MHNFSTLRRHHRTPSQRDYSYRCTRHTRSVSLMDGVGILPPPARGYLSEAKVGANVVHRLRDYIGQYIKFHLSEPGLPISSKNLRDRPSGPLLNDSIKVHKRTAEQS